MVNGEVVNSQWDDAVDILDIEGFAEDEAGSPITDYRDLDVWNEAITLTVDIYQFSKAFPSEEKFGLSSQIRRAAASVPANIAEGYGRGTTKNFVHFLRIAQGSLREVETFAILAAKLKYRGENDAAALHARITRISKMLRGLIRALEKTRG